MDDIPPTLQDALLLKGGQQSRGEKIMIDIREDFDAKTIRKSEHPPCD